VNRTAHFETARQGLTILILIVSTAPLTGCFIDISTLERSPDLPGVDDAPKIAVCCFLEDEDLTNDVSYTDKASHGHYILTMLFPIPLFADKRIGKTPGAIALSDTIDGRYDEDMADLCVKQLVATYGLHAESLDDRTGAIDVAALCGEAAGADCDHLLVINQREYDSVAYFEGEGSYSKGVRTLSGSLRFPSVSLFRVSDGERLYCAAKRKEEFVFTILPWRVWWDGPRPSGFPDGSGFESYETDVLERYGAGDEESSAFKASRSILADIFGARDPGSDSYRLGYNLLNGIDGPQHDMFAFVAFRSAAELGNASAFHAMGWMFENGRGGDVDFAEAMKNYRWAADRGSAKAETSIGCLYLQGKGVETNPEEAKKWFEKAAGKKEPLAMFYLGRIYMQGNGVTQNSIEGVKWYRKAADQGHTLSMCELGAMYRDGQGLPANSTESSKWFRKAARLGDETAQDALKDAGLTW